MPIALVTGASQALGRALAEELAFRGWSLVLDGHDDALAVASGSRLRGHLAEDGALKAVAGDVADDRAPEALVETAISSGASTSSSTTPARSGPRPLPGLGAYPLDGTEARLRGQRRRAARPRPGGPPRPARRRRARPCSTSRSDAAVEAYERWGGYGSSKAALDQMTRGAGRRGAGAAGLAVDPGDMRTADAPGRLPGRGHLRPPAARGVAPDLGLIEAAPPSGRYRAVRAPARTRPRRRERAVVPCSPGRVPSPAGLPLFDLPPELEAAIAARGPGHDPRRGANAGRSERRHARPLAPSRSCPRFLDAG